jgi:adenylate cyclase
MAVSNLNQISLTYHNLQSRRIEVSRRRISAQGQTIFAGRVIPDPRDLPIGRGRRLEAAVLFLDISGFTQRASETAEEQDMQVRVLSLFFSEIIRIVGDYEGTVEKNTGDGVMAYFAGSAASGDGRHRAVACAMTIFHAADRFINPIVEQSGLSPLRFRICIDHGSITIARLGAAQRFNHIVAVGTAANIASKMLQHTLAGELMVGSAVLDGLPADWRRDHVRATGVDTGWNYRDGTPYEFWLFEGRWNVPTK